MLVLDKDYYTVTVIFYVSLTKEILLEQQKVNNVVLPPLRIHS